MSATGRGSVRVENDFYATPGWCTRAILPHLSIWPGCVVLDPCCGDGAILREVGDFFELSHHGKFVLRRGIEIDATRADAARESRSGYIMTDDALSGEAYWGYPALVITNPPYSKAMEFVQKAVAASDQVAMLLRLNWLASKKRSEWLRAHTPDVYVLPRRPSFTGRGTDATDYAWMVWRTSGPEEAIVRILDVEGA